MAEKTYICRVDEIETGTPYVCPHRGAPLCEGPQCGTTAPVDQAQFIYHRENEIVRCAWHGWEFDIKTGAALVDPGVRARTFPVTVEAGEIYVTA
ncbi:MAG: hypothetical protein E5Y69_23680 [Mesorhizobium sp.]|nr:MAG: hypothetical protein E5Y69_23680 [Mesorhizobium sp.]